MKSTRENILRQLLAFPGSTINDLAEAVGINAISIRHHLTSLQAEDLVTSAEERHGVGRPRLIYSLTEKGVEAFPSSYIKLTQRLLRVMKNKFSEKEIDQIFQNIGEEIADSQIVGDHNQPLEKKLTALKSLLTEEGFVVELSENETDYTLTTLSCPYYRVGFDYPQICAIDYALISKFVSKPVKIETCIFNGEERCTFQIQK